MTSKEHHMTSPGTNGGKEPPCAVECRAVLEDHLRIQHIEATISHLPPLVKTPYLPLDMLCPHGVLWYLEPTSEQIAEWAKGGVL